MAQASTQATIDRTSIEQRHPMEPADHLATRLAAFERFEALPFPDARTEGWRRTDLTGIDLTPPPPTQTLADLTVSDADARAGATVDTLDEAVPRQMAPQAATLLKGLSLAKFSSLTQAAWRGGAYVYVPQGAQLAEPILVHWRRGPYPRLYVVLGPNARATIVETHDRESGFTSGVVDLVAMDGAQLTYVHVQNQPRGAVVFSHQHARVGKDAKLVTLNFAMGGRMSRSDIEVELIGQGAESDMLGLVFGESDQQFDFHTLQGHRAPDTRSDLLFKSALDDRSHSTYTGVISIGKDAPRSEAYQANRNLLLSDAARADTEPKLEILIDDVARCTHGATIGPVDDDQMFYLQSRGLDPDASARLIVEGFFEEVLRKAGDDRATAGLLQLIAPHVERLAAH